jgi:sarcosine oxidase delta subunit
VRCPFCGVDRPIRDLHAHLAADHASEIRTEELGERVAYTVTCPYCSESYRQPIRKGAGDPQFLAEYERQIQLVAFDMLINHVLAEHGLESVEP